MFDQGLEAGLKNGQLPAPDRVDLGGVDVRAEHVVAVIREHGGRDEADVTSTDDADLHGAARILDPRGLCYDADTGWRGVARSGP